MSRGGENLPELSYFLNNGRGDVTREELSELLTVVGKASFAEDLRRGGDGADLPPFVPGVHLECEEDAAEPFPGFGEGTSLEEYGLAGSRIVPGTPEEPTGTEAGTAVGTTDFDEWPERPPCEGRPRRPWESPLWEDFDDGQPDYPDDREYL